MPKRILAFDFGASSGRAMLGLFDGQKISMEELHRFPNDPVQLDDTLYWDFFRLWFEVRQGLTVAARAGGFDSVGVDTWGVDFGLLDGCGRLLEAPVHYRDERNVGYMEKSFGLLPREAQYARTGLQFQRFNTLYQLMALGDTRPELLERAHKLVLMPDLFSYFLCGETVSEYTMASTTALLEPHSRTWDAEIMKTFSLPEQLSCPMVQPGAALGGLKARLREELSLPDAKVFAVAGHDTASAVAAAPLTGDNAVYISSGTWSLMGVESPTPVLSATACRYNMTNEGGYDGKIRLLKNIMGLWLVQECCRQWKREGQELDFAQIAASAQETRPFACLIDPDDAAFMDPGDMPGMLRAMCAKTGQYVPQTVGEIARCIYESLALAYRATVAQLAEVTGKTYDRIHVVGGGIHNRMLCQCTADATGLPVIAGPSEATVLGNIGVQLIAQGELSSLSDLRQVVAASFAQTVYTPQNTAAWDDAYETYGKLYKK